MLPNNTLNQNQLNQAQLSQSQLSQLESILDKTQILTDTESIKYYAKDWTTYFDIQSSAVLLPSHQEQVINIVKWANQQRVRLIPSGGRTGLSGGACATQNEVIVSLEKMNKILNFNPIDSTVLVQGGVIIEQLQQFAISKNLYYPVDFAARGSAHIGGSIATNAGGIRVLKYGMTRRWVQGLSVVTGKGDLITLGHGLIKNATGPDLMQLMIGSEGIFGLITEALIKLAPPPQPQKTILLSCPSLENVMSVFELFSKTLDLSAFEMFQDLALKKVCHIKQLAYPFSSPSAYSVVTDITCTQSSQEEAILELLAQALEQNIIQDALIAQSPEQSKTFWRYREDISESLSIYSPYKNDVSVKISDIPEFVKELSEIMKTSYPHWEVVWFGHIGDGNLHLNILRPEGLSKDEFVKQCQSIDPTLFKLIQKFKGAISAEHGVGLTKKPFLGYSKSPLELEWLKTMKNHFDPNNIMNSGKVIDINNYP